MTGQLKLGLTAGVPEQLYHRGIVHGEPSLSHSGMKTLLGKSPAHFRHEIDHPEDREQKPEFDLGSAAHAYHLGTQKATLAEIRKKATEHDHSPYGRGPLVDAFLTNDAKKKRDLAYSEGLTPVKSGQLAQVAAMQAALSRNKEATRLLAQGQGTPEVSGVARDPESGVLLRARFDYLRHDRIGVDYKTVAKLASPRSWGRTSFDFSYYLQHAVYEYVAALCDEPLAGFEFVVQEKTPPYAVSVMHFGPLSVELGRLRMRQAIDLYAACVASGEWPGYPDESVEVDVPFWALRELDAALPSTDDDTDDQVDSAALQLLDHLN